MIPIEFLFAKMLFERNLNVEAFQITTFESVFVLIFTCFYFNKNLKKETIDKIKDEPKWLVVFVCIQIALTSIMKIFVADYLSLTIIGISTNLIPLLTVVFAYFTLGEKLQIFEIIVLVLTVVIIALLIYQQKISDK